MFDIQEELKKLPGKPGVYIMHDDRDTIIYVGKAINLKNRVRQYFQNSRNLGVKKEQMVQQIARFEYIITDSELEALDRIAAFLIERETITGKEFMNILHEVENKDESQSEDPRELPAETEDGTVNEEM